MDKHSQSLFLIGDLDNVFQIHPQLCKNDSDRSLTINLLVSIAVTNLLCPNDGSMWRTSNLAYAIVMLENCDEMDDFNSVACNQTVATKVRDLHNGDSSKERDMLKFFSKRISCSCLKGRYSVARRTLPKLGKCSRCKEVKERHKLMVCGRCKVDQYCSDKCQIAHWHQAHHRHCRNYVNAVTK